jgi:hypothetical protein
MLSNVVIRAKPAGFTMNTLSSEWHTRIWFVKRECTALGSKPDYGSRGSDGNFSTDFQEEKADSTRYCDGRNGPGDPFEISDSGFAGSYPETSRPRGQAQAGVAANYDTACAGRTVTSLDFLELGRRQISSNSSGNSRGPSKWATL